MAELSIDDYNCIVRRHGGNFHVIIHELGLIGSGPTIEAAWNVCAEKFERLAGAYRDAGALESMPRPQMATDASSGSTKGAGIGAFTIKTFIAIFAVLSIIWIGSVVASSFVLHKVENVVSSQVKMSSKEFWAKLEREVNRMANTRLSPEKQAEISNNLRAIVSQIKPFTDELAPIFNCPMPSELKEQK